MLSLPAPIDDSGRKTFLELSRISGELSLLTSGLGLVGKLPVRMRARRARSLIN